MKSFETRASSARRAVRLASLALAMALAGCASTYYPGPPQQGVVYQEAGLTIGELLEMLRAGRPQAGIVADLRVAGLRVAPAPADIDVLIEAGASQELVAAVREARLGAPAPEVLSGPIGAGAYPPAPIYDYGPYDPYPGYWAAYPGYHAPWFPFAFGFSYFRGGWGGHYRAPVHVHPAPRHFHPPLHSHPAPLQHRHSAPGAGSQGPGGGHGAQPGPRGLDLGKPIPTPRVLPGKRSR